MTKKEREKVEEFYREEAKRIAAEYWDVELTCPINFVNRKWKRMNACLRIYGDTGECEIVLNHKRHEELGVDEYLPILKHELVHWYLWTNGEPCDDDDPEFIRECFRIGASFSYTQRAQKALKKYKSKEGE